MARYHGFIILCLLFSAWCTVAFVRNDDISIIHQRVMELMVWPAKENISIVVQNATAFTETLNSSCYWPDVNYYDKGLDSWFTAEHVYRVTTMLQALTVNGSSLKNDPRVRAAAHCALNIWLVNDWQNPNWYFNEIRIPLHLTGQLLMLSDNATSFETEKIKEISYRAAWWLRRGTDLGANLLWMIQIEIYRSLATNNVTGIEQGFTRMWQDITLQSANTAGVQYDWSYHFHGRQLLSGSYGSIWAELIFSFVVCTQDTQFEAGDQPLSVFVDFITKGDAWMIRGSNWDFTPIGRAIARPEREQRVGFYTPSIRKVADFVDSNDTKIQLLNFADRLDGLPNASSLIGNKNFFISDYLVHHRENWTAAIHMQSYRTQPAECINGENQKAEHTGQGVLNLYIGNTFDYDNIYPLWDWQAINGITIEHDIPLEHCNGATFPWILLSFVGGVSDDQYGLAMMDTASHNLTAQRSWHFYDDAIIALATNLTLRTPTTAWTTLASRLLPMGQITIGFFNSTIITVSDGNYSFPYSPEKTSNVQWIHVGGSDIVYLLQLQQQYASVGIELKNKTANYLDIGAYNATISARVLTIWINHGVGPYTLDYNYIILPNVSLSAIPSVIKQYSEEQIFSCVSTNSHFHGTMWPSLKRASFVLWDNVTTTFSCNGPLFEIDMKVNDGGAYLFSENATSFTVTASHPTRLGGSMKVTVDRAGSGEGCAVSWSANAGATDVTLSLPSSDAYLGASVSVTCKK